MSERPETDKANGGGDGKGGTDKPQGGGTPQGGSGPQGSDGGGKPDGGKAGGDDKPKGTTSGSATYPDGYHMEMGKDGSFTLTDPDGQTATWDRTGQQWLSRSGDPMSDTWSAGHYPGSQGPSGPGTPQAHPS